VDLARLLASMVFPVPGKSSSNTCPPEIQQLRTFLISSRFPKMTDSILLMRRSMISGIEGVWEVASFIM
jgi:hypothetical protein